MQVHAANKQAHMLHITHSEPGNGHLPLHSCHQWHEVALQASQHAQQAAPSAWGACARSCRCCRGSCAACWAWWRCWRRSPGLTAHPRRPQRCSPAERHRCPVSMWCAAQWTALQYAEHHSVCRAAHSTPALTHACLLLGRSPPGSVKSHLAWGHVGLGGARRGGQCRQL